MIRLFFYILFLNQNFIIAKKEEVANVPNVLVLKPLCMSLRGSRCILKGEEREKLIAKPKVSYFCYLYGAIHILSYVRRGAFNRFIEWR